MSEFKLATTEFDQLLQEATDKLKNNDMEEAYKYIMNACEADPNSPQPHNLLGIWYEFRGMSDLARKHYRVAYVLDPTYKPASENLERISTLFPYKWIPVNFGEVAVENVIISGDNSNK